jgi:hypothetical protein
MLPDSEAGEKGRLCVTVIGMPVFKKLKQVIRITGLIRHLKRRWRKTTERFDLILVIIEEVPHIMLIIQVALRSVYPVALMSRAKEITKIVTYDPKPQRKNRRHDELIELMLTVLVKRKAQLLENKRKRP